MEAPVSPADRLLAEQGGEVLFGESGPPPGPPKKPGLVGRVLSKLGLRKTEPARPAIDFSKVTVQTPTEPSAEVVEVQGAHGAKDTGPADPPPPPTPKTAEQIAFEEAMSYQVNLEVNIFNSCYQAVKELVRQELISTPKDSAELGQSMFGGGIRTPLENAEPLIALETYRQVRHSLRLEMKEKPADGPETGKTDAVEPVKPQTLPH